ncbi:uncharacterized protein LOC125855458 [Solanum stenotomum]|uniref:uncharacterized protein LOC125855458 n=1 Tax=Solanum stenotomum TaxID=172797 RepID=UPI0020D107A7|nr:uncharacterized protein LOC125855458 [Solanum stenotomum]
MVFAQGGDCVLSSQGKLCIPNVDDFLERIMEESHSSRYLIQPGATKMYHDLREVHWWSGMKSCIAEFVAMCPNCQQFKADLQRSYRGTQFTVQLWKSFQKVLGSKVTLSATFNPQTDSQVERTIHTFEEMLRACVLEFKGWFEGCEAELIGLGFVHQSMEKVKTNQEKYITL